MCATKSVMDFVWNAREIANLGKPSTDSALSLYRKRDWMLGLSFWLVIIHKFALNFCFILFLGRALSLPPSVIAHQNENGNCPNMGIAFEWQQLPFCLYLASAIDGFSCCFVHWTDISTFLNSEIEMAKAIIYRSPSNSSQLKHGYSDMNYFHLDTQTLPYQFSCVRFIHRLFSDKHLIWTFDTQISIRQSQNERCSLNHMSVFGSDFWLLIRALAHSAASFSLMLAPQFVPFD